MGWIEDALEAVASWDWVAISQVVIVLATVGTAVFTGWALRQFRAYAPQPFWLPPVVNIPQEMRKGGVVTVDFVNAGDGAALNVRLDVTGARVNGGRASFARVEPGKSASVGLIIDGSGRVEWDMDTGGSHDSREYEFGAPEVTVLWSVPPRRDKTRQQRFKLFDPRSSK